jgi:outer membrane murein-binding lipoprotein Lpp
MHTSKKLLGAVVLAALAAPAIAADPTPAEMAAQLKKLSDDVDALRREVETLRKDLKTEQVRASRAEADLLDLKRRAGKTVAFDVDPVELEKQRELVLSVAVDADADVRDLRTRIRQERETLANYDARGLQYRLTRAATVQNIETLQTQLDQRIKQIKEDLRRKAAPRPK